MEHPTADEDVVLVQDEDPSDVGDIDADRFSRVIAVIPPSVLKKLLGLKVLVSGINGVGAEIAKNIILSGVGSITLHDTENTDWLDLSANFYLSSADIGKNRAEASISKFSELNPYSQVKAYTGELSESFLDQFSVVVMANANSQAELLRISDYCHNHQPAIVFIKADCRGLFSAIFTDFGPMHRVLDKTGEEPKQAIVVSISQSNPAVVMTHDEKPHGLSVDDYVSFDEVKGMTEINKTGKGSLSAIKVVNLKGLYGFEIDLDTTNFSPYIGQGLVNEVRVEHRVKSTSYRESLDKPGDFVISDFAKFGRAEQYHFGFQALLEYQSRHNGALPQAGNKENAQEVVQIAIELNEAASKREGVHNVESIDKDLIETLALTAQGCINPLCAFVGGVVGQEVMKQTGKFNPIHQWYYFDSLECLPEKVEDRILEGTRYDGQIAVFGKAFQQNLFNLNLFLVGSGALGCEFIKNFALMGVSSGSSGGRIFLTDMDNIEKSNLTRQFLFRDSDIGKMKSACAAHAVSTMNNELRIDVSETPVGEDTEDTFTEDFWKRFDVIVNALDNVKARLYVDSQCVKHHKPLLESGTLGTKANSQVILPDLTESYGTSRDPPDAAIPMCTLKNFPHQIEHTIEWARDKFGGYFTNTFEDANNFVNGDDFVRSIATLDSAASKRERLEAVDNLLALYDCGNATFATCVKWARLQFQELFHNMVAQLLFNFPEDAVTSTGASFWSGPKRPPIPLNFDPSDNEHLDFIVSSANLLAQSFRIPQERDRDVVRKLVSEITVAPFQPQKGVRIKGGEDDETVEGSEDDDAKVARSLEKLATIDKTKFHKDSSGRTFDPQHFEKDDDSNFHVAFMTSASNLRATNYRIKPADFHKTKKIAGRIIPAIATTTAMITGLVCLELYKIAQWSDLPIEKYRNSYVNLALPSFVQSEPMPCVKHKSDPAKELIYYPEGWTLWDSFIIDEGDITFQQLLDFFKNKHNLTATSISCGTGLIYNTYFPAHKERLGVKISEYVKNNVPSYTIKPSDKYIPLTILCENDEEQDVELPEMVKVKFA